jgi:outer membrane protein TolC
MPRRTLLVIPALALLAGCQLDNVSKIDAEVQAVIREYQHQTLGRYSAHDPDPVPPLPDRPMPGPAAYRTDDLATRNPPAADLPARPGKLDPLGAADPAIDPGADPLAQPTDEPPAAPPGALALDLEATLAYAIANARDYRFQKEDLFLTAIDLLVEKHLWGPRFFDNFTTRIVGTPERGDHDQVLEIVNELGVTQRLPWGGSVSASAIVNFVDEVRLAADGAEPVDSQASAVQLAASIPLLRGAGMVAREDLIQAYRNLVYATRDFERFRREFLFDIASEYYDLVQFQSEIVNQRQQLRNFRDLHLRTAALANAGRLAFFEVQRAEQQELFARNALIVAQDRYDTAVEAFKVRLGVPEDQSIVIRPSELAVPEPALEPASAVKTAWDLRLDLQTAHDVVDDARRSVANAKNNLLPDVDVFASTTLRSDPGKQRAGLDLDAGDSSYTAGVTVGAPLDRRIEQLGYRRALIGLERTARSYDLLRDNIAFQVRRSVRNIRQAVATLELQNRNIATAEKRLVGVRLREDELGPRDFIEAQDDLLEALNTRDGALRNLRVSVLQYLLDTGQLRVSATGQWQPPAQLVEPRPQPQMPSIRDILSYPERAARIDKSAKGLQ